MINPLSDNHFAELDRQITKYGNEDVLKLEYCILAVAEELMKLRLILEERFL